MAFIAIISTSKTAASQEIPINLQAAIFFKVLSYDGSISSRGGSEITIFVVTDAATAGQKSAILAGFNNLAGQTLEKTFYHPVKRMKVEELEASEEEKEALQRPEMPMLPAEKRKSSFEKAELGFSEETAMNEAKRCLRCDLQE